MAEGQLAAGGKQPAWTVMRDCLANALSYDARVCDVTHYQPFAEMLRDELIEVAGAIAGIKMQATQIMQLFMHREEGGVDVHGRVAPGARARTAALMERGPDLRARLRQLYPDASPDAHAAAEGISDAVQLLQLMRSQGIAVGPYGLPQRVGIIPQQAAEALRPPAPAGHLHAAFNKQASLNRTCESTCSTPWEAATRHGSAVAAAQQQGIYSPREIMQATMSCPSMTTRWQGR